MLLSYILPALIAVKLVFVTSSLSRYVQIECKIENIKSEALNKICLL